MKKWYEESVNDSSILSGRIRLARNIRGYKFPLRASEEQRLEIIDKTARTLAGYNEKDSLSMLRIDLLDKTKKLSLIDKHIISPWLAGETKPSSVFLSKSERLSIMVMEEDHIRIQAIEAGDAIETAYERACLIDDILEENCEYAFEENWGYLTSCPTNAGTGLRASFMLHLPYLEMNGQIGNIARSISKFGFTLRGTFGEGSNAYGSVYQISNQVTLGLKEEEIINNIKSLAFEIVQNEKELTQKDISGNRLLAEDKVWRTYGVLTNARRITEKEAINSLSVLKMGVISGVMSKPLPNIYDLIINIRTATISEKNCITDAEEIPYARAEYLREKLLAADKGGC